MAGRGWGMGMYDDGERWMGIGMEEWMGEK